MTEFYISGFINGVRKFSKYLKDNSCFYDIDNYHSFRAIDIEDLNELVDEFLSKDDFL